MSIDVMKLVAAGVVLLIIMGGVSLFQEVEARNKQTSQAFMEACESTGGKAVWNFKYWECLK